MDGARPACTNLPAGTSKVVSMKKSVSERASYPAPFPEQAIPSSGSWITQTSKAPTHEPPTCERCASDDFLVYERLTLLLDADRVQPPCWDVEFWCGQCESFYGMLTTFVPNDRQAVRLASENPRYVKYRVAPPTAAIGTKVARGAHQRLGGTSGTE